MMIPQNTQSVTEWIRKTNSVGTSRGNSCPPSAFLYCPLLVPRRVTRFPLICKFSSWILQMNLKDCRRCSSRSCSCFPSSIVMTRRTSWWTVGVKPVVAHKGNSKSRNNFPQRMLHSNMNLPYDRKGKGLLVTSIVRENDQLSFHKLRF